MSARSKARKRALDVLFEASVQGVPVTTALAALEARTDGPLNSHTRTIVEGVELNQARIDELLATYSSGWTLERMPTVDLNVLRIGAWEILWSDVPDVVAISEAVELASSLSTEESPSFVNGVLAKVAEIKPHLVL
ncbi:MAG: transcription antitermination factor NusB [Candidatus Nanopelagicales bacterium]|nr:transcription antitermination factor NusB [Candidatus Nanopelagicales bacterium]